MTLDEVLIEHSDLLRRVARYASRRHSWDEDEAYAEVLWYLPQVLATYDAQLGALEPHLYTGLSWYLRKSIIKQRRTDCQRVALSEDLPSRAELLDLELRDEVISILAALTEYDRVVLLLRHVKGLSYSQLAGYLHVSKGTARLHVQHAESRARQKAAMLK